MRASSSNLAACASPIRRRTAAGSRNHVARRAARCSDPASSPGAKSRRHSSPSATARTGHASEKATAPASFPWGRYTKAATRKLAAAAGACRKAEPNSSITYQTVRKLASGLRGSASR